ncbi:hypothetical protein P3X46_032750 [Hevea brasiliensis]|uniref:Uncharacterized protein n=1 Tax=Hevea brasiliensis TaxID=3981 RepID=A0ABQ9KFD4_HEVBR|nr:hypothetical protein P3X46_032750 [Hevea brasiliensis]
MGQFAGLLSSLKKWKDVFFFMEDTVDKHWGGIHTSLNCFADKRSGKLRLDAEEKVVVREIRSVICWDKISIKTLIEIEAFWWESIHVTDDPIAAEHYNNIPI